MSEKKRRRQNNAVLKFNEKLKETLQQYVVDSINVISLNSIEDVCEDLTVNELKALSNKIESFIAIKEANLKTEIEYQLIEEIKNFMQGVGEGYTEGDYYAPNRYYSKIKGLKNLRHATFTFNEVKGAIEKPGFCLKILNPLPLPESIEIDGQMYIIETMESKNFTNQIQH